MATLTSTKIKNTYDALLKATDNDAIGSTAKQITDGLGNGTPLYISTTQIGIGVTPEATYDLHVYSNAKVGGNLTVTGDLTVDGTVTTVSSETLTVTDPLIELAKDNTSTDALDIGFYGKYAPSGTTLYAGLFRDTGDSKFKLFRNLQEQPTTTVNTSGTGYTVATLVADLEGTLTGVIASTTTATTQTLADNSTKVATTAYVDASIGNSTLAEVLANGDTTGGGNIVFGDSDVFLTDDTLMFGASNDLVIYHDGSNSFIREKGTGNLYIDGETSISLRKYTGAENMLVANTDGSVELYYDNSKKLETTSTGVTVTGDLTVDTDTLFVDSTNNRVGILTTNPSDALNVDDDVSGSVRITIDNANAAGFSTLRFEENDTERAALYYSNAADTFNLQNNTNSGNLRLQTTNSIGTTTSGIIINGSSEAVELYYAGTKKFETTSTGVTITGTSIHTGIEIEDTSPQILFDETDVTANWRNRVSGGSWRVQYAPDGSSFSDQFVVGGSNATFETDATFAGDVTVNGGDIILGGTGRIQGIDTVSESTDAASKGYVDSIVTAQDLDFSGDSGTGSIDLDSQTFTIAGTTNEIETSASGQTLTIGLPNDVTIGNDLTVTNDLYIPSYIYHTGDTNTFFGFSGNDTIIFRTAGSTRLEVASDGHIGINESDPDTILHISDGNTGDPSTNAPVIRLQNTSENCSNLFTDGDVVGGLEFYNDSIICTDIAYAAGVNAYVRAVHDGSDSPTPTSSLEFGTGTLGSSSTRMTIDSSGDVSIGNAASFGKLRVGHIGDNTNALVIGDGSTPANDTGIYMRSDTLGVISVGSTASFSFRTGGGSGTERMRINSDGGTIITADAANEQLTIKRASNTNEQLILGFHSSDYARIFAVEQGVAYRNLVLNENGGNVGIGTDSPDVKLHVDGGDLRVRDSGNVAFQIISSSSGNSAIQFGDDGDANDGRIVYENTGDNMLFYTNDAEKMRIDSDGNVGINQTSPNDISSGATTLHITGTVTSKAGAIRLDSSNASVLAYLYPDSTNGFTIAASTNHNMRFLTNNTERMRIHSDGIIDLGDCAQVVPSSVTSFIRFVPAADTTVDLGAGSKRWEEVFSVQSSINTSDENEKQQIENLDEVELRVAQRIKGLIRKFKWNSAVENKGDNARIHFGVIAQDLQRAFEAEGLDAEKYGLFCSDTWWEEEVTETDEEGNEKTTIKTYEEYKEGTIEKTRLGVRYTELLAFVIAAL